MTCERLSYCVRSWMVTLFVLLLCQVARGGFERSCSTDRRHFVPRGICGDQLSFILSTVCSMYNKRSANPVNPDFDGLASPDDENDTESPRDDGKDFTSLLTHTRLDLDHSNRGDNEDVFLPRAEALSIFKRGLNVRGTITCECCIHRCNVPELRQYCRVPNPNLLQKRGGVSQEDRDLLQKALIGQQLRHKSPANQQKVAWQTNPKTDRDLSRP